MAGNFTKSQFPRGGDWVSRDFVQSLALISDARSLVQCGRHSLRTTFRTGFTLLVKDGDLVVGSALYPSSGWSLEFSS
jgi:hypothetical protein